VGEVGVSKSIAENIRMNKSQVRSDCHPNKEGAAASLYPRSKIGYPRALMTISSGVV